MSVSILFQTVDWQLVQAVGRRRFAEWESRPRYRGPGNYPNSERGHIAGAAGEHALALWLDRIGVAHEADPDPYGWDRVTDGATLEVKCRSAALVRLFPWHVAQGTGDRLPHRQTRRTGAMVVWGKYLGPLDERLLGVELLGAALANDVTASPLEDTTYGSSTSRNYVAPPDRVYTMDQLATSLRRHDRKTA